MAHKRISSMYFMVDSKDDLTYLPESQMGTTCFVIEDACEYKCTSDGRWIQQMASSAATTPGAGENVDLTGYATEGYVDTKIANLVGSAPENLDTLHEIAVAFKENGDVLNTLNEAIGEKANRSEIPDVGNFQEKGDYALKSEIPDLTNYALKEELPEVPSLEGYALKSEIPSIAGLATEEYVTDAIADIEHPLPSTTSPNQHLITNEKGEMIWEERSHWTEEQEDYLVNTSGSGKLIPYPGLHSLKPNKEYTIIHNGTEYKCISQEINGTVVLGNLKYAGSSYEDTGEPFFFPGIDKGSVTFYAMFSEGGEHTFSIFGPVDIAKPLSDFYMPQSVPVVKFASKGQAVIVEDVQNGCPTSWTVATIPTKISELDNDVKHATEEYVDTKVAELVDNAPETLDTLNEIATTLSEHAEVTDILNQAIGNKVDKTDYPIESSSNQYLTTDAEGNKVWEEKLAYAVNERKELVTLTTISGDLMLNALFTPSVGDTCLIIYNDQEYHGTCNTVDIVSSIQMAEGENFPLTSLRLNCFDGYALTDSELSALSGTIQIFVTTNIIHPIDNAFIDLPIKKGEQHGAVCLGAEGFVKATNILSAAINQGRAHGQTSLAINSGTTHGENSFAQGFSTIASGQSQMVIGAKNIEDTTNTYIQIAGNGSDERSNAYALDWNGNAYFDGDVFVQGDGKTLSFDGAKKVATEEYVDIKVAELVDNAPETLNTLKEVADALNENASTAEALNQAIGNKVDKTDYPITAAPNQVLTTNEKGEKVWENKLAHSQIEEQIFLEESVWDGTQTNFPAAVSTANINDRCIIYLDDIAYPGIITNKGADAYEIVFDEDVSFPWNHNFIVSKPGLSINLGGAPLEWAVGKLSATVQTSIIHTIDPKYLDFNIESSDTYGLVINNYSSSGSAIKNSVSINGGIANAENSLAIGTQSKSDGEGSIASSTNNAKGTFSTALGFGTTASTKGSLSIGTQNKEDIDKKYAFIIGNGSTKVDFSTGSPVVTQSYSNSHAVDLNGNAYYTGEVYVGGNGEQDFAGMKKLATEEYVEEKLLDSDLVRATAFNELADTVKGLDKYCAFMKQGDQIKLGNVQEYSKMQEEMLNGANKFHATLAITFTNEEGLLISETCYAKSVMSAINMDDGSSPYTKFSFETFDGEIIKFQWNADNTISNITIISAEETIE